MTEPKITDVGLSDISKLMAPGTEKRQSMQGFDDDYVDIVDYIIRSTHKIWEEWGMGLIYTHYRHNAIVHTAYGTIYGREQMIASSLYNLSAYPDRRAFGDDVIWGGNDVDGFYSSHRITNVGTNYGHSLYGPPTGKRVRLMTIADCVVKENRVCEEWLVRDELAAVRQMGYDVKAVVARIAERGMPGVDPDAHTSPVERVRGQTTPEVMPPSTQPGFDVEDFVRRNWHELWNWRLLNRIRLNYAANYVCYTAGARELYGHDDLFRFVLSWLATFPDLHMQADHFVALGNDQEGYRTSLRWTMTGTHTMPGIYGEPSSKRVRVLGITQQHIKNGKFIAEWTGFDELALMVQLYTPQTGDIF